MKMLMFARFPHEPFNAAVKDGSVGQKIESILKELKPEAVYFTETKGHRTAAMIVELEKSSQVPVLAEPWFLTFNADVEFHVVMDPQDLKEAGLEKLGEKWG